MKILKLLGLALCLLSALHAQATSVPYGKGVSMKLVSVDGTSPFTYQWQKNGVDIAGATQKDFVIAAVTFADVGTYTLKVTNSAGFAISAPSSLAVTAIAPGSVIISIQPL